MATPLEDELTAIIGSEATQGVRRRADVSYTSEKPDYAKEMDASLARVGSYVPAVTGLARQIGGDQEGAMADYRRSAAIEAEADSRDSAQSTDWRDIDGVGSALGFARKTAIQSIPDAIMSLGAGGAVRGLARRTAMDVERRAIASRVAADIATPGVDTPLTRQVAAQQATARAATAGVAAQQRREAVDKVAGEALERMPAAQRRIDRAGRAGAFVGAAAGQFPGMVAGSREQLEQTDQEGAAKIALGDAAAAALGAIPAERVLGRLANNPAARQATQEGAISLMQRAGKVAKETGTQAALEGTTEAAQAAVQRAGHAWVNDNISLVSREALDEYVANFIGGAVIGGAMAGSIETGQQGAGALRDAGRWAWDAAGTARTAIRERLGAQADRLRAKMATDEDEATTKPSRKGSKQGPNRTASDMFSDARRTLDGLANRGMDAASGFLDRFAGVKSEDDLDARADAVMERMQAITQRADGAPIGDGVVAKAPSFTQKWLLSQVNPDFLARVPEDDALRLGRILDKYANGRDLAGVEARTLNRVISNPESGLTQDVLDTFVGIGPLVRDLDKRMSATADADAPRLAQPRREELAEVTEDDRANAEADALAGGEDASGLDIRDLNSGNSERGPERATAIDRMESARRSIERLKIDRDRGVEGADAELATARAEGRAALAEARSEILGELKIKTPNNKVFARNAAHPEPYNKRRQDPDTVELVEPQPFQLDNKVDMRPVLLDLGSLIQRQQTLMRNEGTTETDIAPEQALLRGLAEAQMAGLAVNPDTINVGDINVKGRFVMKITPRIRRYLKDELPKSAKAFDPDTLQPVRDEDALLDEFARSERPDDLMGENVIDSGVPEDNRALVPRERPPGVRDNGTEQGTRRKEPDNPNEYPDVEAVASLAERAANAGVNAAAAEAIDSFLTGASTVQQMADGINASGTRQTSELFELLGLANMGRGGGYAPRPRNAPGNRTGDFIPSESIVSDVNADAPYAQILNDAREQRSRTNDPAQRAKFAHEAGVKIGMAEIQKEYDAGLMNDGRYDREVARLQDPESGASRRYLQRASRGDFDTARVTHRKADNEARKGRDKKDRAADPDNVKAANKADRKTKAGLKDKRAQDVGLNRAKEDLMLESDAGARARVSAAGRNRAREDEVSNRSDGDAPADGKATPKPKITPYQREAEGKWVNDLLKLLGLDKLMTLTVGVRTDRGHSGRIFPRRGAIELSDNLTGVERQEVLLHELGHGIVYAEVAKQLGVTVDEVVTMFQGDHAAMIEKANPELFAALMEDFNAWRLGITSGTKVLDARAGRSPKQRLENMRERLGNRADLTVGDLKAEAAEYELSFDEWLADNISRALLARKDVTDSMTRVEKLFTAVAKKIREIYDSLTNAGYKPAPSVEQWVASMFDPNVTAVRQATGTTVTPGVAHAAVEAAVTNAAELFNRLPRAAGATTGVGKAVDPKAAPFPGANRIGKAKRAKPARSFASMVEYARNVLRPKERQLLYDLFNTPVVHQRLMKVYAKQPEILAAMEDAQTGMEARIAAGYLAWQNKQFNVGPKGRSLLNGIGDDLLLLFKVAGKGLIAERLLNDIARGHVRAMRQAGREYDVQKLATRHGGTLQQIINKFGDLREKIWAPVSRALESNSKRMFESGVPAMRQIAGLLYKPTGTTGTDRGMVREVVHRTAQFAERAASIMDGLSAGPQRRVLQLLQEQADEKRLGAKITSKRHKNFGKHRYSPKVRRAVASVRELMNESFAYMEQAGVRVGYRKNFFPVMLDLRNERAKERLTALLMDPKFEDDIRAFYEDGAKKPKGDDAKAVPIGDLVKRLVDGATGTGAPAKTNAGAPNFRGANYRVMEFIYRLGDKAQIKEFADLQTKNPAEAFARYLEPMVRRAEYARRFKDDGTGLDKLLGDMSRQGADDNQIREAREAVEAALGTYGSDLSPTLEAISPALAKRFSGPKTRATTQGLQAYQNARLLPLALISSFVDPMGIAVRTGGDFATSWKGFKAGMRALVNKDQRAQLQDMMKLLGASSDMATMEALQQGFGGAGNVTAARVNDFIFRWNGMAAWTRATRYMALTSAHHFLLKHGSSSDATSQRYLRELGLQPGDIKADPAATTIDGAPRQAVLLMDAAMLKRATPAQREADARVKSALMQFVDDAILRPNSQQVPQWHSDPYMGLVTQYKAFSYAIYDQIVGRIDNELKNGNSKVLLAAASYMPIIIAAEILRDVAQGDSEDKDEWGPDDYLLMGVEKSGLYSPAFGALTDAADDVRNDRLPGSSNIGPTASQARNVTQALNGHRDLGKEFESALPGSAWYRKWNDGPAAPAPESASG